MNQSSAHWRGGALALCVALGYATNSVLAGVAYEGGSNAMSVFALRSSAAFLILLAYLSWQGRRIRLAPKKRNRALALGVILAGASYGLLAAMEVMAVPLCVITLYTYPLLVAAYGWLSGAESFSWRLAVGLLVAFGGLVLALDLFGANPHPFGIAMSFAAAVGVAALLLISERERAPDESLSYTLHMLATCMTIAIVLLISLNEFALPTTTRGWLGFAGVPLAYSFAVIGMFIAVTMIGSLRSSLLMNLEPVSSVILSYLLLSQSLSLLQLFGVACVIGAIVTIEAWPRSRARPA